MHILAPHISCICNTSEMQEAVNQGYKEIYIMTLNGCFKHHILRGENRFVRTKVTSIPGYTEPKIEEGMNFLPAGKIPYALYEQVLAFFKKVMEVKTAELEAMIHILYNPEQGYHLGVPPQTISKASVSYDWNYVPAGTSIIVDIHSHNTMNAFFSSTDNRDDGGNISFSGVFGKLKDREPETCWRFNYYAKKYEASVEDLFDAPVRPAVEIPEEWINNVNVQTYVSNYKGGYSGQGNAGRGLPGQVSGKAHEQLSKWRYDPKTSPNPPKAGTPGSQGNPIQNPAPNGQTTGKNFEGMEGDDSLYHFFGVEVPEEFAEEFEPRFTARGNVIPTVSGPGGDDEEDFIFNPQTGTHVARGNSSEPEDPDFGVNSIREDYHHGEGEADPVGKSSGELALLDAADTITDPQYEAIATIHGLDVANAWHAIATEMSTLDGHDELNEELICDMAGLSTDEGQLKIMKALFERLSDKNRMIIQTNGL